MRLFWGAHSTRSASQNHYGFRRRDLRVNTDPATASLGIAILLTVRPDYACFPEG